MEQGLERFRFAWAGSLLAGEAYYFRIHGPVTLIEHDNTQNGANHIHSVWRDLAADFGHDALAERALSPPAAPLGSLGQSRSNGTCTDAVRWLQ